MSITKLKWQWQGTNASNDLTHVESTPNPQTGRVITGMLTGDHVDRVVAKHRTSGGSNGSQHG